MGSLVYTLSHNSKNKKQQQCDILLCIILDQISGSVLWEKQTVGTKEYHFLDPDWKID